MKSKLNRNFLYTNKMNKKHRSVRSFREFRGFSSIYRLIAFSLIIVLVLSVTGCGKKEEEPEEEVIVKASTIGDIQENTLKFNSNGTIVEIACEDYSESEADITSLQSYIQEEIDAYNNEKGVNKISFVEYDESAGFVRIALQYSDINTYNEFNNMDIEINIFNAEDVNAIAVAEAEAESEAARKKEAVVKMDTSDISEEELAAAGYDLSDLENGVLEESVVESTPSDAKASLTDAESGSVLEADDIDGESYMMIISDYPVNYVINSGTVLYTNRHAETLNQNSAKILGDGRGVIVYKYIY